MKKIAIVLFAAMTLASCGGGSVKSEGVIVDSTAAVVDTTAVAPTAVVTETAVVAPVATTTVK